MPALLHSRAAAMASSSVSPATNRRAMRRVVSLEVTQLAKPLLSASLSRVDRSMRDNYGSVGRSKLVFVLFQKLFGINGGHATGARRGDGLAIAMVLHVTGNKHARDGGEAAVLGKQVAIRIHLEFAFEDGGVRIVTDGHEYAMERNFAGFLGFRIAQPHSFDEALWGKNFVYRKGGDKLNFFIGPGTVNHDLGSAKFVPAVNEIDLAGVAREEIGFLHRGITAADDGDRLATEKITVAGSAGGNAVADQFLFALQSQKARGSTGGDDERFRFVGIFSSGNFEWALADVDFTDCSSLELRSELLRLFAHVFDEFRPHDAVRETWEIFHVRGQRELATGFMPIQNERLQVCASSVNRSG